MTTGAEQLARLRRELDDVDARAAALARSCSVAEWQERPEPGAWSASECLQHLVLSADAMLPRVDEAMEAGRRAGALGAGPFGAGVFGRILIWALEPPYRVKSRTAARFQPASAATPDEDVAALHRAHDRVRSALDRAQGLALDRLTIQSPFFERARYNLYAAFALLPVHARRHLWQAERTVRLVHGKTRVAPQ